MAPLNQKLFEQTVQVFAASGRWIASSKFPRTWICVLFGVILAGFMIPGLWVAETENDIDDLYIQKDSRLKPEFDTFKKYFGGLPRTEATIFRSETGDVATKASLDAALAVLEPLFKAHEADKCDNYDGLATTLPVNCTQEPFASQSLYCTCETIAANPNATSITVTDADGDPVEITQKDLCENPPVPEALQQSSFPSYSASLPEATSSPVYQGALANTLGALEQQYGITNDPTYNSIKTTAVSTCEATIRNLEAAANRSDLIGAGTQCAGAVIIGIAGPTYAQATVNNTLDTNALIQLWSLLVAGETNTTILVNTYNTACGCSDGLTALGASSSVSSAAEVVGAAISDAVVTAFAATQYNFASEGTFLSHTYAEVASCIGQYTHDNFAAMTTGIFDSVLSTINLAYSIQTDATPAARAVAEQLILAGNHPAYNETAANLVYATYVENAANLFVSEFLDVYNSYPPAADTLDGQGLVAVREAIIDIFLSGADVTSNTTRDIIGDIYVDESNQVSDRFYVEQAAPVAILVVAQAAQNATPAIIQAAATALSAPALAMPETVTVAGQLRALPVGWGIDRFPCSRASPLDFFREGDFDYPYNMKQLDRVAPYVYYFFNTPFFQPHVEAAQCIEKHVSYPLKATAYLEMDNILVYQAFNFDALDAAENAFLANISGSGDLTIAAQVGFETFIANGGAWVNASDPTGDPLVLATPSGQAFLGTAEGLAFAVSLSQAIGQAAGRSSTIVSRFEDVMETFFAFGFWWRPTYGTHIQSQTVLTDDEIRDLIDEGVDRAQDQSVTPAMCVGGNRDLETFVGEPIRTCFLSWSATKQPIELAIGDLTYLQQKLASVGAMRCGFLNYNEGHERLLRILGDLLDTSVNENQALSIHNQFEKALINDLEPIFKQLPGTGFAVNETHDGQIVDFMMERSINDVIDEAGEIPTGLLIGGYITMLVYAVLTMIHIRSSVYSHTLVGAVGVIVVAFSTAASLGLSAYLGIKFTPISSNVIPFIALGIGVDDMFVLSHTYIREVRKSTTTKGVIGKALGKAGPSVTFTSLSNFVAFLIASATPITVVQLFCYQMVISVLCNYFLLLFIFVPFMVWDCRRTLTGRSEYFVTCCHDPAVEDERPKVEEFCEAQVGPNILNTRMRITLLIIFFGFFGGMIYTGFFENEKGVRISDVSTTGTYQHSFSVQLEEKFTMYSGFLVTVSDDFPNAQQSLLNATAELGTSEYVTDTQKVSDLYWLHRMLQSVNPNGQADPIPPEAFYPAFSEWLAALGTTSLPDLYCIDRYTQENVPCTDIVGAFSNPPEAGSNPNVTLRATKGTFFIQEQRKTSDFLNAIEDTRDKVDPVSKAQRKANPSDKDYKTYVFSYVHLFWEQYLHTDTDLYMIVGLCLVGVFVATFLFQFSLSTSLIICLIILMTDIEILGLMPAMGVKLNGFSVVNLCVTTGLAVEFTAHIAHQYLAEQGDTRRDRALGAMTFMGIPMFHGAISTLIALLFIAGSDTNFIRDYYFSMFFVMVVIASLNGLVLLPIILSFVGSGTVYPLGEYMGEGEEPPSDENTKKDIPLQDVKADTAEKEPGKDNTYDASKKDEGKDAKGEAPKEQKEEEKKEEKEDDSSKQQGDDTVNAESEFETK